MNIVVQIDNREFVYSEEIARLHLQHGNVSETDIAWIEGTDRNPSDRTTLKEVLQSLSVPSTPQDRVLPPPPPPRKTEAAPPPPPPPRKAEAAPPPPPPPRKAEAAPPPPPPPPRKTKAAPPPPPPRKSEAAPPPPPQPKIAYQTQTPINHSIKKSNITNEIVKTTCSDGRIKISWTPNRQKVTVLVTFILFVLSTPVYFWLKPDDPLIGFGESSIFHVYILTCSLVGVILGLISISHGLRGNVWLVLNEGIEFQRRNESLKTVARGVPEFISFKSISTLGYLESPNRRDMCALCINLGGEKKVLTGFIKKELAKQLKGEICEAAGHSWPEAAS